MLYKKYHRNYVRKFRKGTEFSYKTYRETHKDVVWREPYIGFGPCGVWMTGKEGGWVIVFQNGVVDYKIKIEKDVIQEIS